MSSNLSFGNVNTNNFNTSSGLSFGPGQKKQDDKLFKGDLVSNAAKDLQEIGSGITTLAGAIIGYDKEARQAIGNLLRDVANDPFGSGGKQLLDMMLSTYNITVDDLQHMPLGDIVANVASGIWEHPISAGLDIAALGGGKLPTKFKKALNIADESSVRIRGAEDVLKSNIRTTNLGEEFVRKVDNIEKKYKPELISEGFKQIELRGVKNIPQVLRPVVTDLLDANNTYKNLYVSAGVELADDVDMAARELIANVYKVPVSKMETAAFEKSKLMEAARKKVIENDIRPIFHLEPKIIADMENAEGVTSNLLKRKFGTMDYTEAAKDLSRKADTFTQRLVRLKVKDSIKNVNKYIDDYNELNGTKVKKLEGTSGMIGNKALQELNTELKKTMLSGGTYLGANVITTTLGILNNFNLGAAKRTLQNLPKFRQTHLDEATTPLLNIISRVNNKVYQPMASLDRYLERIGARYIEEAGLDNAKYMQSIVPSLAVPTSNWQQIVRSFVPFGTYPTAAINETLATIGDKPLKASVYNQIQKIGQETNEQIQSEIKGLKAVDPLKVIRQSDDGKLIQRSTVVTPIQAANMFLLGEQGDAIQIPIIQFINKLISGTGNPNVFTVDGRNYRVENGKVKTAKGDYDLIPSLAYVGRQILSPVQFYNQVLVPLMSDKYIRDETKIFNQLVDETQYSNLGNISKRKVTTDAREKLGKRLTGTYEYNYYKPFVSRRVQRNIKRQMNTRRRIQNVLQN